MTCFEDLSNEIFYEIIDYLDTCDAYEAFYELNHRFQNLFQQLTLPYKITLDSVSKKNFQQRYQSIIIPHAHRILSLCLSDWICSAKFSFDLSFIHLESLVLNEIKSTQLSSVLNNLALLPRLYSLSITAIGRINDPYIIHRLIFSLPVLKYCNTTFEWSQDRFLLILPINIISPIKYFISKSSYNLRDLCMILPCMPQLIHLSYQGYISSIDQSPWNPVKCDKLTYLHLDQSISYIDFELFFPNLTHQVQILRLTLRDHKEYLDSKRWERIIRNYLPCLSIFDLQFMGKILTNKSEYSLLIDGFISSFWIEKKWFFHQEFYHYQKLSWFIFCSVKQTYSEEKINSRFMRHIQIENNKIMIDLCSSQMILSNEGSAVLTLSMNELNPISPFEYVKKLIVKSENIDMNQLMNLLSISPNLQMLVLSTYTSGHLSIEDHIYKNKIQKLLIHQRLRLIDIKEIMLAYPCLKSFEMKIKEYELELIMRFILKQVMDQHRPLRLLSLQDTHRIMIDRLQRVIDREELLRDYSLEEILGTACLSW